MSALTARITASVFIGLLLSSTVVLVGSISPIDAQLSESDEISAASGTNRFVVWHDNNPGNYDIFIRRSTDNGATWKPVVDLGDGWDPQIVASSSKVYVVWDSFGDNIFLGRSNDNGSTWMSVKRISNTDSWTGSPDLNVSGQDVYVSWRQGDPNINGDIFVRRSTDGGASWSSIKKLCDNVGNSDFSQVGI